MYGSKFKNATNHSKIYSYAAEKLFKVLYSVNISNITQIKKKKIGYYVAKLHIF